MVDPEYLLGDVLPDAKDPIFAVIDVSTQPTLEAFSAFSDRQG